VPAHGAAAAADLVLLLLGLYAAPGNGRWAQESESVRAKKWRGRKKESERILAAPRRKFRSGAGIGERSGEIVGCGED
jgi:hypothetical protein